MKERGVSCSFIRDKLKEDNLQHFCFLFLFFFFACLFFVLSTWLPLLLVELSEGRTSMASRGCGAMEQRRYVSLGGQLQPAWTCLFPRAFPAAHRIGFHCLFFFCLVEFNTYEIGPKKKKSCLYEMCLKTSEQEMKLSVGLMFKWASPLTVLLPRQGADLSLGLCCCSAPLPVVLHLEICNLMLPGHLWGLSESKWCNMAQWLLLGSSLKLFCTSWNFCHQKF